MLTALYSKQSLLFSLSIINQPSYLMINLCALDETQHLFSFVIPFTK